MACDRCGMGCETELRAATLSSGRTKSFLFQERRVRLPLASLHALAIRSQNSALTSWKIVGVIEIVPLPNSSFVIAFIVVVGQSPSGYVPPLLCCQQNWSFSHFTMQSSHQSKSHSANKHYFVSIHDDERMKKRTNERTNYG